MDKRWLLVILAVSVTIAGIWVLFPFNPAIHEHAINFMAQPPVAKIEKISLWQYGREEIINRDSPKYTELAYCLISTLEKVNLQAKCAIFEDRINLLKQNGRAIEVTFGEPVKVPINQWIRPEERHHIPTDENGYRILINLEKVVFVLDGDLKGYILTKSAGRNGYGCWAISRGGKVDRTWISKVEKAFKLKYEVEECSVGFEPEKAIEYDENTKTLTAYVWVNCCGVNVTVEKENNIYKIVEKQYGELCRCMCVRKVTIYNVPVGAMVEFVSKDGVIRTLTPRVDVAGFCGWSTYGKCSSDEDCVRDGCSGQVCRSRFEGPIGTTCEWFDCYDAKKFNVACKCVNGECQWVRK